MKTTNKHDSQQKTPSRKRKKAPEENASSSVESASQNENTTTSSSEKTNSEASIETQELIVERIKRKKTMESVEPSPIVEKLHDDAFKEEEDYDIVLNHGFTLDRQDILMAEQNTSFVPIECLLLDEGDFVPDFKTVSANHSRKINLLKMCKKHKYILLYFFRDNKEKLKQTDLSQVFSESLSKFKEKEVLVIGISNSKSLNKSVEYEQDIILDKDLKICKEFRCLDAKLKKPQSVTYLISEEMKVLHIFHKISEYRIVEEILNFIKEVESGKFSEQLRAEKKLTHFPLMDSIHDASSRLLACITGETLHDNVVEFISEGEALDTLFNACHDMIRSLQVMEPKTRKTWEIIILYLKKTISVCHKIHKDYSDRVSDSFNEFWPKFWNKVFNLFSELRNDERITSLQRHELVDKMIHIEKEGNLGSRMGTCRSTFEKKEKKRYLHIVFENFKKRPTREHFLEIERNFYDHSSDSREEILQKMIDFWIKNMETHAKDILFVSCNGKHAKIYEIMKMLGTDIESSLEEMHAAKTIVSTYPEFVKELALSRMRSICTKMLTVLNGRMKYLLSTNKQDSSHLQLLSQFNSKKFTSAKQEEFIKTIDIRFEEEIKSKTEQQHQGVDIPFYKFPPIGKVFQDWILILREAIQKVVTNNSDSKDHSTELRNHIATHLAKEIETFAIENFPCVWTLLPLLSKSRMIQNSVGYTFEDNGGMAIVNVLLSMKNAQ